MTTISNPDNSYDSGHDYSHDSSDDKGQGGRFSKEQTQLLAAELERLCRPDRQRLDPKLVAALRVRIVSCWQEYAACAGADPDAWFLDTPGAPVTSAVVRTCAQCPVRRSCLATAVLWSVEGIWAGTTTADRRTTTRLLRAGAPVGEVLTATLDHAETRLARRAQYRRLDWFHTPAGADISPATSGHDRTSGGNSEPGAAG